jgi:hypothetical protein
VEVARQECRGLLIVQSTVKDSYQTGKYLQWQFASLVVVPAEKMAHSVWVCVEMNQEWIVAKTVHRLEEQQVKVELAVSEVRKLH